MVSDWAGILGDLGALIGRDEVSEDYVRFRMALLEAQVAVAGRLEGARQGTTPPAPVIGPEAVPWDDAMLGQLLTALGDALQEGKGQSDDPRRLTTATNENRRLPRQLARAAAFGPDEVRLETLSAQLAIGIEALVFFGRVLAAPFVAEAVHRSGASTTDEGCTGHCPWCGSVPGLARLRRETGKRVLSCSLCGADWEFARLQCPFCEAEGNLSVLSPDEAAPYTIETCDRCRGYLKTVDSRKLSDDRPVASLVHACATLHLDMIAEAEGCRRGLPYAAMR